MTLPPFSTVLDEQGPVVRRVLVGLVGPHDADDCWQETFVAALRAYDRLRPDSNVRGWLFAIAHRKAVDVLRSRGRLPLPSGDDLPEQGLPDPAEAIVAALDAADGVWGQVRRLPPKQHLALAYRFGADLDYAEIARLLECSQDAARRSVFEGLRTLRTGPVSGTRRSTVEGSRR